MTKRDNASIERRITEAAAKQRLSAVVDDLAKGARRYVIERNGEPVAAIVSIQDFKKLEPFGEFKDKPVGALALVGLWSDVGDEVIDEMIEHIYKSRET